MSKEFQQMFQEGEYKETCFRKICNNDLNDPLMYPMRPQPKQPLCQLLHHNDPYLKLGPFKLEVFLWQPYRTILHDFLTDKEMNWMMDYSRPRLSKTREVPDSTKKVTKAQLRAGNIGKTVAKTVQVWFDDIKYVEDTIYALTSEEGQPNEYIALPLKDPYTYRVVSELMLGELAKKNNNAPTAQHPLSWLRFLAPLYFTFKVSADELS